MLVLFINPVYYLYYFVQLQSVAEKSCYQVWNYFLLRKIKW